MGIVATIARILGVAHEESKKTRPSWVLVFRTAESNGVEDPRHRRIIELANGISVEEITEFIYYEELRAGAWLADIGLWQGMIRNDLAKTIGKLAAMGFLRLELNDRDRRVTPPELLLPDDMHQREAGSTDREERIPVQAVESRSEI